MKRQALQLSLASCLFAISQGVWAESFVLQDIKVNGLNRITAGTVLSNVPVRVGQSFDDRMTGDVVNSLYRTGLFDDVSLSRQGNVLIVKVQERKAIGDLKITGNKAIEDKVTSLTVDDVNKVIKKYFKTFDNWTVVNAGDFEKQPEIKSDEKVD